jgi:hypothetical protein
MSAEYCLRCQLREAADNNEYRGRPGAIPATIRYRWQPQVLSEWCHIATIACHPGPSALIPVKGICSMRWMEGRD